LPQGDNHICHRRVHRIRTNSHGEGLINFQTSGRSLSSQDSELLPVPKSSMAILAPAMKLAHHTVIHVMQRIALGKLYG
jgi:hypothetical protein